MIVRRSLLLLSGAALAGAVSGAVGPGCATARAAPTAPGAANQWFALQTDDGRPVPNLRAPVELVEEIEDLTGAIWAGPATASVKLVEFYDYNCPWCRAAEGAREALMAGDGDLRVGLVNNPILSPGSAQAAKVDLAVLALNGAGASIALHRRLFGLTGRIDGPRALDAAASLGFDRRAVENEANGPDVREAIGRQLRLAASLGLAATPSYVVGGAAILGYPGPDTLKRIVADTRRCGTIGC